MRSTSKLVSGIQVFGVAGTSVVSFGIAASDAARERLMGFGLRRTDVSSGEVVEVRGYKVFPSLIPDPGEDTLESTFEHPIQSFVWDDYEAEPGTRYRYSFVPMRLAAGATVSDGPLEQGDPVEIAIRTERLVGAKHDIYFNRGVTAGQYYSKHFGDLAPDQQPTPERVRQAKAFLSRDLDEQLLRFIDGARRGDQLRCCFYEFSFRPALDALRRALDRGVDVRIIVDMKVNEHLEKVTKRDGTVERRLVPSAPRTANAKAIREAGLPPESILMRQARADAIAHNKFMVLVRKGVAREVWTGSTNLTDGGIYGQANVGHRVRIREVAESYLAYWTLLSTDPGAPTSATRNAVNVAFRDQVEKLTPAPADLSGIPSGTSVIFSPRDDLGPLDLYVKLLAEARDLSCITLAFGVPAAVRQAIAPHERDSVLKFMLLEKKDQPRPGSATPFVSLNWRQNIYQAWGAKLSTPIGRWVVETSNRAIGLNTFVSYVHLKVLLHDPLGPDPIVVTGSANFSDASTRANDENMLLIRGDRRVADIYFCEFNRLFGHYYFRAVFEQTGNRDWQFLKETPNGWLRMNKPGGLRMKRVEVFRSMAI